MYEERALFISTQTPHPLLRLQNSWLTFPQSSSSNRPQKELFCLPLWVCPKGIAVPYGLEFLHPFAIRCCVFKRRTLTAVCIWSGEWGWKREREGVLLMLLTLFFPFPCLSSLECPCDNCVSVSKALQHRSVFTAFQIHSRGVFCEPSSCYKIHIPSLRRHSPVPLLLCCHGLELGRKSWCKQTQAGRPCDVDNLWT